MPRLLDNFQLLAHQFDLLVEMINDCRDLKERMHLLRHTRFNLNEIDALILSSLRRDMQDTTGSPPPEQPSADS
jgi:hypothetical protein